VIVPEKVEKYGKPLQKALTKENVEQMGSSGPSGGQVEEGKLLALYNVFDTQSRGKIARNDFVRAVTQSGPAIDIIERLGNKVRKGGERLIRALMEEFQEADAPFGCNGQLPLNNF
jgi:hypothetical protein